MKMSIEDMCYELEEDLELETWERLVKGEE